MQLNDTRRALFFLPCFLVLGASAVARAEVDLVYTRVGNGLPTSALVLNALSANPLANQWLATSPLSSATFSDSYMQAQLMDPDARKFMKYLVSCALGRNQQVTWVNPTTSETATWHGSMGLCSEWNTQAPSQQCLELVSSCVLARNNALGVRVVLSVTGEDPVRASSFVPADRVPTDPYVPRTYDTIASVNACAAPGSGNAKRNCGWTPAEVGSCTPGSWVRVGAGGRAPDQCGGAPLGSMGSQRVMLRVCRGLAGCNSTEGSGGDLRDSPDLLAQSEGSCGQQQPAVAFRCPADRIFNVMVAPYDSTGGSDQSWDVAAQSPASYPAPEAVVYETREGAFYGTIFGTNVLQPGVDVHVHAAGETYEVVGNKEVYEGSIYQRMFSCNDPGWTSRHAVAISRLCALPGNYNCATVPTGECSRQCQIDDGSVVRGNRDYERCASPGGIIWEWPLTSSVHIPW